MSVQLGVRTRKFNYHSQHSSARRHNLPALNNSSGKVNDVKCCQKVHRRLQFWESHQKKLSKVWARLQSLLKELSNEINLEAKRLIDRQIDFGLIIKWIVLTIGKLIHQMGGSAIDWKAYMSLLTAFNSEINLFSSRFLRKTFFSHSKPPVDSFQWVGFRVSVRNVECRNKKCRKKYAKN